MPDEMQDERDAADVAEGGLRFVGLGGSAGSLPALQRFFENVKEEGGFAYIVVVHLSPDHDSILAEILQRSTALPVEQIRGRVRVEANRVYVIPPGRRLSLVDGHLQLTDGGEVGQRRYVVDHFFRTLAETHGERVTAIVLSGSDGDGANGLKRVKERGGLTIGQDPAEAEHEGMPRSAIETGMVDWVLPVREMPERLAEYWSNAARLRLPLAVGESKGKSKSAAVADADHEAALRDVLGHLRVKTGHEFDGYKRATVLRRIGRRMQVCGVETLGDYLGFMRKHGGETGALLQDLLISVTNFFRDATAFEALAADLPRLFDGKGPGDHVRVWVPACATGEEAYSVAMLLSEHAATLDAPPGIQVFATDLDERAIETARAAVYSDTIEVDVSEERLRRFFVREQWGYRVRRELREVVLFALHDLLRDAPFSQLDLVSCRNLLIYLSRGSQERVFDIFHFALRGEGRLFLSVSESAEEATALFSPVDKKHRLYRRLAISRTNLPVPTGAPTLSQMLARQGGGVRTRRDYEDRASAPPSTAPKGMTDASWADVHFQLIERLGPPSLLVDENFDILHLSKSVGRFLRFGSGEPTVNLLRIVNDGLRAELRVALYQAAKTRTSVDVVGVRIEVAGETRVVDIGVRPTQGLAADFLLVVFREREDGDPGSDTSMATVAVAGESDLVRQLEDEIEQVKRRLRESVEDNEARTEELKASNEELQAMNEELRSATEELETGREELQSINEELTTVNQKLKGNVDELSRSNNDLQNLMASTDIATIFLDRDLTIERFTPSALSIFRLIPSDLHRPLSDLSHSLDYPDITRDAAEVLERLTPIEREVRDSEGRWFLARVLPYRTTEDRISGVVLTFFDLTERRKAEEATRASEEHLRMVIENAHDYAIFTADAERRITSWSRGAEGILGYREGEILGEPLAIIFTEEDRKLGTPDVEAETALVRGCASDERWHLRKDGRRFWASGSLMPMRLENGEVVGFVKILRNRTEEREAADALRRSREELLAAVNASEEARREAELASEAKDHFLAVLSHELRTPLTPIMMAVETLVRRADLPADVRETFAMIQRNVRIEARFIDDLLDVTRIGNGKLEIHREALDLAEVVRSAVGICQSDVEAKQQVLLLSVGAERMETEGDSARLQQAVWNLIKNASKFTPKGGEIRVSAREVSGGFEIEVADTGIGIAQEEIELVFDPFAQGGNDVTREFGGLGLGLAIAKATLEAHGGTIRAGSTGPGEGATFTISLPRAGQNSVQRPG